MKHLTLRDASALASEYCHLTIVQCGPTETAEQVTAILGFCASQTSFKSILGLGLLILSRESGALAPGQPVIESTSGSFGVGLAYAGRVLGHPVHLVSDQGLPAASRHRIVINDADLHIATPLPQESTQSARKRLLKQLLHQHDDWFWLNQNDSDLNPEVYRRWLLPELRPALDAIPLRAGCFTVGSGGHFTAFAEYLRERGASAYVADRYGSVTFSGPEGMSVLRGTGNSGEVPAVAARAKPLVAGVTWVTDEEAALGMDELLQQNLSVGGSSGVAYIGCCRLLRSLNLPANERILTFFPDRGELYTDLLTKETMS